MKRVLNAVAVMVVSLLAIAPAEAQQTGRAPRIGILTVARQGDVQVQNNQEALRQGLRERGWVDGQNIAFEYRWADGRYERLPELAADLVRLKVSILVGATVPLIQAFKDATETIPIIMVSVLDPVEAGFVASLARPGGNITGLTLLAGPEIVGKQLELVKELIPGVSHVAVLMNPANPAHAPLAREAEAAGRALRVRIQLFGAQDPNGLDSAFVEMTRDRVGALLVLADAGFYTHRGRIAELAAKSRLPAMYGSMELVAAGGLMAYGPSVSHQFNRAAMYVDKILKGAKPSDLPVEQPTKFQLVINNRTARALGLTIPPSLLMRADQVIE